MRTLSYILFAFILISLQSCDFASKKNKEITESIKATPIEASSVDKVKTLLNGLETGDTRGEAYINPNKYIQHNLSVADGPSGFAELMKHKPKDGFKVDIARAFQDGDFVVTHTKYDFFGPKIGFDIFRLEDGKIVEHWDNLTLIAKPNPSGRTQIDGTTEIEDLDKTKENKELVKNFVEDVLKNGKGDLITKYISTEEYLQHNTAVADGIDGLQNALKYFAENGLIMQYDKVHMILGEGNFVLTVSEGKFGKGDHVAYYDLFRVKNGKIVEHWDVIETIPPKSEWKNENGKF